jgi:hypothetical protein
MSESVIDHPKTIMVNGVLYVRAKMSPFSCHRFLPLDQKRKIRARYQREYRLKQKRKKVIVTPETDNALQFVDLP